MRLRLTGGSRSNEEYPTEVLALKRVLLFSGKSHTFGSLRYRLTSLRVCLKMADSFRREYQAVCDQARAMIPPFGSQHAAPLRPLFAQLRAASGASDKCRSSCENFATPYCEYCSNCCPDASCTFCDLHRLASEFACRRFPDEAEDAWGTRLIGIRSTEIVDYAPFFQFMALGLQVNLAKPIVASTASVAAAVTSTWGNSCSVAPRLVVVDEFSSKHGPSCGVTTTLLVSTPLYYLPGNLTSAYSDCAADRVRRSKFLDRLVSVSSSALPDDAGTAGSQGYVVFGDDDARQVHFGNSPVRLLLHRVALHESVVLLASCSCNTRKEGLVERLLEKAVHGRNGVFC